MPDALSREVEAHDDILVVITETPAEDVDAAGMAGLLVDPDLHPDRVVLRQIKIADGHARDAYAVDEGAAGADPPRLELPVLRALELPPGGRVDAALVPEVTGRCP